ncbi:MAG: DeoR family transcriptional regulator [Rhizobiaceae bacterium MnEN-MB40S]|nr:MAG: DeoR family transcriptional regulator [Rhizobiaceae bacterium MnEN-MB40S]
MWVVGKNVVAMANHSTQRQMEILEELRLSGSIRIQDLARRLDVSEETIRRNVRQMAASGVVRKVHGGVHLQEDALQEPSFQQRMGEQRDAKQRIARHIASMIGNGDSLMLDIGSTTAYVAQALKRHSDLFVVTNSLSVANTLATRNNNRVFMAGGELRGHDGGSFGIEAMNFVRQFSVRYAILSAAAINAPTGFMLMDLQEAEFTRVIMQRAQMRIVAADATKFGKTAPVRITDPSRMDMLVTDRDPPSDLAACLRENEIDIQIAD